MHDNSNHEEKENAMKFFLEICTLLKSISLNHRFMSTCNREFVKLMIVLGQSFNIMQPDRLTLRAEVKHDYNELIKAFMDRESKATALAVVYDDHEQLQNWLISPTEDALHEYLKNPCPKEDPRMTQIDVLKSNAMEIFFNLLTLNSNQNPASMFVFLKTDD